MAAILREWPKIKAFYRERPVAAIVSSIIAGWLGVTVSKNTPPYPAALSTSPADKNKVRKERLLDSINMERKIHVSQIEELQNNIAVLEKEKNLARNAGNIMDGKP